MAKILRILSTVKKYGGDLFEDDMQQSWQSQGHSVNIFNPVPTSDNGAISKLKKTPAYLLNLMKIKDFKDYDYVLRAMNHIFFINKMPKQIVMAYHYDTAFCHPLVQGHHFLTLKNLIANKKNIHRLIVISKYWQDYFFHLGFNNIEILYCGFDPKKFVISESQIQEFKNKYNLHGKKIIYIGNSQRKKGADLVYNQLKNSDCFLVTSGNKDIDLPCLNLNLNPTEYLCLLKSSQAVITYSQFKEGWNRVAHEAMMLGVPVIGSGLGGMGELLQGGNQKIVTDPKELPKVLTEVLRDPQIGQLGQNFAQSFTMQKFDKTCQEILN